MTIDNIVLGDLVDGLSLEDLGITHFEHTIMLSKEQVLMLDNFLPKILVHVGLFKTTSEIKRIAYVRSNKSRIKDKNSRELWRLLTQPEMTFFKIGKKAFWLIVGDNI